MDPSLIGLLGICLLFLLLAIGMYIGLAMLVTGFLGYWYVMGLPAGLGLMNIIPYSVASSYMLSVIPLFVLMGEFAYVSGISGDIYKAVNSWLGSLPGGLSMATVIGCAGFGAVCGSSLATSATMGTVAIPEMRKYGYEDRLATGCVAAGGTLGILIPPSLGFAIYGILTEQSIGKLFMAGILPGILLTGLFILAIWAQCRINPRIGPPAERLSLRDKVVSLKSIWGLIVLFVIVIGGIYAGIFTPTEAAGIGAFGAFMLGLLKKNLRLSTIMGSLLETGKTTAMIFLIMIGAEFFSKFLGVTMLPMALSEYIGGLAINRYIILFLVLLTYVILGCLMDCVAIMILTTPIIYPVVVALGFDPIWYGVIMVIVLEMGFITPPVGLNVFVIKGVSGGVELGTIFRGIMPFLAACLLALLLLIIFPGLPLFLPGLMK
ncbi:MAG: TRAP transporter large permease [Desulfobacteraceae bacterium]|nr:MAG: TRAP transporter large permease [Desulfobacteraceae bacterium]